MQQGHVRLLRRPEQEEFVGVQEQFDPDLTRTQQKASEKS